MSTPSPSPIPGIKVLLEGGPGSGKTHSLRTLAAAGIETAVLFTEPGMDVLNDTSKDHVHWVYVKPIMESLQGFKDIIRVMGQLPFEGLTKMVDPKRAKQNRFEAMMEPLMDYKCILCGKVLGNIGTWGTDKCLAIDSLSGLSIAAIKLVAGDRPALNPSDYGMAQQALEGIINQITINYGFHFVLLSHIDMETDPIQGGTRIYPGTVGQKLAPKLPRFFSDVILAKRQGTEWLWDTADSRADLKTRNAPVSPKLRPDFKPLIEAWKSRGGIISPTPWVDEYQPGEDTE